MAFGFPPRYSATLPPEPFTEKQFLMLAWETFEYLGWERQYLTRNSCAAFVHPAVNVAEQVTLTIENGIAYLSSHSCNMRIYDRGRNKINVNSFIQDLAIVTPGLSPDILDERYAELEGQWATHGEPQPVKDVRADASGFFSLLIPKKGYVATPVLIHLNILVFLAMWISGAGFFAPDAEKVIAWGANSRPMTMDGEQWRLFTAIFLHYGALHLLANMFALMYIGVLLEPHIGTARFLLAYVVAGVVSSLASMGWHIFAVSAGASGAIFGMYGVFLAMLTTSSIARSVRRAFLTSISVFIGYNLLNGMKGHVDNSAHVGGLLCGMAIGYSFYPFLKNPGNRLFANGVSAAACVLIAAGSVFVYTRIPMIREPLSNAYADSPVERELTNVGLSSAEIRNPDKAGEYQMHAYETDMRRFRTMEKEALRIYSAVPETKEEEKLYEIKDQGLYYWNENLSMLKEAEQLRLPDSLHARNQLLMEYCRLRIESYELMYKKVAEHSNNYDQDIFRYEQEVAALMSDIK